MAKQLPPWFATPAKPSRPIERIVPSDAEARNGWDEQSLTAYVAERRAAQDVVIDPSARRPARPTRPNSHHWNFPVKRAWAIQGRSWRR